MNTILREATIKDFDALSELQQNLVKFERPFDKGIPQSGKVCYYDIMKLINDKNTLFIAAETNNEIIGCGFGQIRNNLEWAVEKKIGYIGLMIIKEKYRRKNTGRLIIEKLIDYFRGKKISNIILETYCINTKAIEAYKKYGFKEFVLQMKYDTN
ncbi:MAG: GNAT family N-acetyltransferase [Bacteroidetes bacterium]|nr:GNAT family N-acetyltransferase [Bacteroidota bacterium]